VGIQGLTGETGQRGVRGPIGPAGFEPLPTGKSVSGDFELSLPEPEGLHEKPIGAAVTFPVPLAAAIPATAVEVLEPEKTSVSCPGVGQAARGHLCVYVANEEGVEGNGAIYDPEAAPVEKVPVTGTGRFGFGIKYLMTGIVSPLVFGTYTVTAA
jgi:hypothetical protein